MKTEDELDAEMAKMFDEVTEVKMVNGKPYISDEQTIAEMEFQIGVRRNARS